MTNNNFLTKAEFKHAAERHEYPRIKRDFRSLGSADIAERLGELGETKALALFRIVPKGKRPQVFAHLELDRQISLLEHLPEVGVIGLLNDLDPVDRTKLLESLPEHTSQRLLDSLTPKERDIANLLLSYPENSVGRLMSPEFLCIPQGITATEGLERVRWSASQFPENLVSTIFVVDEDGKYLGHVSIASLISADPPRTSIDELVDESQPGISAFADQVEAVDFFRKYDRALIPVVDHDGVLVGVVESDDIFDIAEEGASEDIHLFGGQSALEDSYFQTSIGQLIKKRVGWLAILFFGTMFTTNALEHFDDQIKKWSFLVLFLPLIISSGGNSGSQAASLMIRGLAVREITQSDWWRVFKRELAIGMTLGVILGTMGFVRVVLGGGQASVAIIVGTALMGIVIFGALVGSSLPFLLKIARLDPAVSSSPVIASVVDIVGIVIYFNIAIQVLNKTGIIP